MSTSISDIYNLVQELSWYFGNQGFDGTCCGDLSLVEYTTLKYVNDKKHDTMLEIANALNISKSGISKIINRLESKDFVLREHSVEDGRVCCVGITSSGAEAVSQIIGRYTEYLAEILAAEESSSIDNIRAVLIELVTSVRKQGFISKINTNKGDRQQ